MNVTEIPQSDLVWASAEPPPQRRAPRKWGVISVIAMLLALSLGSAAVPVSTDAYGPWTAWVTRYYIATPSECFEARLAANRFVGPIQFYNRGCVYAVRTRRAAINTTPWVDYKLQIENTAPLWAAWGMRLEVNVSYNGTVAKYDPASLWCTDFSFLIKVTPKECKVWDTNTGRMLVRMAYDASFVEQGMLFSVQRGAKEYVFGTGPAGVTTWP